ncbi:hypothetical protein ACFLZG_06805 [Thermodesulfobacteriota bacterium]
MRYSLISIFIRTLMIIVLCLYYTGIGYAEQKLNMGGWEMEGAYNKHFNVSELDEFKGVVVKIMEVIPLPGMSPGVGMIVRERGEGEEYMVHVCPLWFAKPKNTGIKKGDTVKVRGVLAEINGKDVFMASKIKKGNSFEFKVRLTRDGKPFWTMTQEELAKERAGR